MKPKTTGFFLLLAAATVLTATLLIGSPAPKGKTADLVARGKYLVTSKCQFSLLSAFDPARSQFSTWLFTVARNMSINVLMSRGLLAASDLHLAGIVSEHGYQGRSHWLMFLFEAKLRLASLPPPHREGRFGFFPREAIASLKLPQTDRERLWPWFWEYRGGSFAAHCHCFPATVADGGVRAPIAA